MKRFLSLALVGLLVVLPMGVKAATQVSASCTSVDDNGVKTCTVSGSFDTGIDSMEVTLTEEGGAEVTGVSNATGSEYVVGTPTISGSSRTFTITHDDTNGPSSSGEVTLFSFSYKVSGETNCKVLVSVDGITATQPEPSTPEPQKQTGSSVPYIALGTMVVLAGGAYLLTRNKSKMFNI